MGCSIRRDHSDKIAAVIGINPLISGPASQAGQLAFIREQAEANNNPDVLTALKRIGPAPYAANEILEVQALVDRYGGVFHRKPSFLLATIKGVVLGLIAPWDIPRYIEANNRSLKAMHDELSKLDLRNIVTDIKVPVGFMLGRYDRQVSTQAAIDFLEHLSAPRKQTIWFEHSAHNIPFEEPELFRKNLRGMLKRFGLT